MNAGIPGIKSWAFLPLLIAAVAGIWLAADGRMHPDEPSYLYSGAYQTTAQIIAGDVQPSSIPEFSRGRILHALIVKAVMTASESGKAGFRALLAINFAFIAISIFLVFRILATLLPAVVERGAATVFIAMTPLILYMSLKTLADNEALLAVLIANYALLRIAQGRSAILGVIVAVGLAVAALSKNQMVFLLAAFWAAMCIVPISGIVRRRLAVFGMICGVGGILLTLATLEWLGIGLAAYLSSYREVVENDVPLVAKLVNIATELGALWILLPVALLSSRRRELLAFGLWFVFATAPFALLLRNIEARHIAGNLVAVAGLFALALEVITARMEIWRRLSDMKKGIVAILGVVVLMAGNAFMLAIMPHRTNLAQLGEMLRNLDERYGAGRYALLTARGYTDFHVIRVLWPEVDVRYADTAFMSVRTERMSRGEAIEAYLGNRHLESVAELALLDRPSVYMGYRQTFAAENMRTIVNYVSPKLAVRLFSGVTLIEHLHAPETRWLWGSPEVTLKPIAQAGHYEAFEVSIER